LITGPEAELRVVISGTPLPKGVTQSKVCSLCMDEKTAMWMMKKTHKFRMQKPEIPQDRMKKAHHSA
jgi:hypothetical protein